MNQSSPIFNGNNDTPLRVGNKQGGYFGGIMRGEREEMRPVTVARIYVDEATEISASENLSLGMEVEQLSAAASIEEQLHILKVMVKNNLQIGKNCENTKVFQFCIKLLVDLYLLSLPKNPLKQAIARVFLILAEEYHVSIAESLSTCLDKLMISSRSLMEMNSTISSINCCFDNSMFGVQAVSLRVLPVLRFFNTCLKCYIIELRQELSPARKMEICQLVHNSMRAVVSLLQKCQIQIKELIHSEAEDKDCLVASTVTNLAALIERECNIVNDHLVEDSSCQKIHTTLSYLLELIISLMSYADLPLDTHTNCGLVLVLVMVILSAKGKDWVKDVTYLSVPWKINLSTDTCQLSICSGLLNVLNTADLKCLHPVEGVPIIQFIFHELLAINQRATADSGMVLGLSRALLLLSRNLVLLQDLNIVNHVLPDLLQFVWIHLEHYMDSVRHNASNILLNLVKIGSALQQTDKNGCNILTTILQAIVQIPVHRKSRYIGLATFVDEMGCQMLMEQMPDLACSLLNSLSDPTITTHVTSAAERLMLRHLSECSADTWRRMWIYPILDMMSHASPSLCGPLQTLLAAAVSHNPGIVTHILPPTTTDLRTLLICIRLARKQGAFDGPQQGTSLWRGILDIKILEQALIHQDVEIRISALSLLAESHRSTETFLISELQLIKTFLVYNINTPLPSSRQQTLALLKKILTRLKESSQNLNRKAGKKKQPELDSSHTLKSYNTFLLWLLDFSFSNLFPGANFGRRGSSLQILTLCQEILTYNTSEPVWTICPPIIWTRSNADILLECLKDTYENNKMLALRLLIEFPAEAIALDDPDQVKSLIDVCLCLVSSHRPPDCVTAAYLFRMLVHFPETDKVLEAMLSEEEKGKGSPQNNSTVYLAIHILVSRLSQELAQAKHSLYLAAATGPMYGSLFCIRQLLSDVSLVCIAHESCWRALVSELVSVCFQLNEVVGPIVNSSSPEGHLPMDFQSGMQYLKQNSTTTPPPVLNVTAQMVLLCSWRTVKEVSLFLGELSEKAPISSTEEADNKDYLITEKQVLAVGDHLATLLSETKHRGAFEQAYVGFCHLCGRLWRHSSPRLHRLPRLWLHQLMDAITWGKGSKLCATRRSAGLPFIVQALVTTELQIGGNPSCFQQSMLTLLVLADSSDSKKMEDLSMFMSDKEAADVSNTEEYNILGFPSGNGDYVSIVEARTHALNILRSLFRHSLLGELVTPYVAQGVIVAVQGFKCKTWAERNSATLLFSALVTRIFGVRRSREELSMRNRMTGRIFFQRYPVLYDFLLEELKEAVAAMETCHSTLRPALFPVLLLLARLYPSSLEGTDSNLQLGAYAPFVHRCALSSVLKIRVLAAKALVPLVAPNQCTTFLQELFELSVQKHIPENFRHGLLLQIFYLLEEALSASTELEEIEHWIVGIKWLLPVKPSQQTCFISPEVYLHILHIICTKLQISHPIWSETHEILLSDLLKPQETLTSIKIGREIYLHRSVQLLLELSLALHSSDAPLTDFLNNIEELLVQLLHHSRYEVVNVALIFLGALLDTGEFMMEEEDDSTLPVDKHFSSRISEWDKHHGRTLGNLIRTSKSVGEILVKQAIIQKESVFQECRWRIFLVLSHCPEAFLKIETQAEDCLKILLNHCQMEYESCGWTVLKCAGALTQVLLQERIPISDEVTSKLCCTLLTFSSAEMSTACRVTVAEILINIFSWLQGTFAVFSGLNICMLWTIVVTLLDDDCAQVRELISSLATQLDCTESPVISNRARELLVEYFVSIMVPFDPLVCVTCLVIWCLSTYNECDDEDEENEDRVFDKGEMNVFAESVMLTEVVCGHLKNVLCTKRDSKLFETPLSDELKQWLVCRCWPCQSVSRNFSTLREFVVEAERCVTFPTSASHFLLLNKKTDFLKLYRTKKLTEVIREVV